MTLASLALPCFFLGVRTAVGRCAYVILNQLVIMKIVVAYSGGLDTSVLLLWLKEKYNAEIIAYCADVGQGEELDGLEEKALNTGASKCYIGDLKRHPNIRKYQS